MILWGNINSGSPFCLTEFNCRRYVWQNSGNTQLHSWFPVFLKLRNVRYYMPHFIPCWPLHFLMSLGRLPAPNTNGRQECCRRFGIFGAEYRGVPAAPWMVKGALLALTLPPGVGGTGPVRVRLSLECSPKGRLGPQAGSEREVAACTRGRSSGGFYLLLIDV